MCMSCGCGEYNDRHKDGDITLSDLAQAASNHDLDVEQVEDNIHAATRELRREGELG